MTIHPARALDRQLRTLQAAIDALPDLRKDVAYLAHQRKRLTADVALLTARREQMARAVRRETNALAREATERATPSPTDVIARATVLLHQIGPDPDAARHRAELLAALDGAA